MIFDLGVASNEKSEKIRKLLYLLTAHKDGGLYTLVRRAFEEDNRLAEPQLFMQKQLEKLMFDTGKYILEKYNLYEE